MKKVIVILFVFCSFPVYAGHRHLEKWYQNRWCDENGGITEVVLNDRARIDCLTEEYAIEFDFAPKWAESVGQSLYYSIMTNKKPGIVLIIEHPDSEGPFLKRLETVGEKYDIKIWTIIIKMKKGKKVLDK